jgi:hypothetical protein
MQALSLIARDKSLTVVFPLALDALGGMAKFSRKEASSR